MDGRDFLPKFASFPVWEIHVKFFYIFLRETDVLLKQIMLLSAASEANCQEKTRNQQKKVPVGGDSRDNKKSVNKKSFYTTTMEGGGGGSIQRDPRIEKRNPFGG